MGRKDDQTVPASGGGVALGTTVPLDALFGMRSMEYMHPHPMVVVGDPPETPGYDLPLGWQTLPTVPAFTSTTSSRPLLDRQDPVSEPDPEPEPGLPAVEDMGRGDIWAELQAGGLVTEDDFVGLGSASIAAGGTATLEAVIEYDLWVRGLVLDGDIPAVITVSAAVYGGIPSNVGNAGAPMSLFLRDSTRFGGQSGPGRFLSAGQRIRVVLANLDHTSAHIVSAVVAVNRINPFLDQLARERRYLEDVLRASRGNL